MKTGTIVICLIILIVCVSLFGMTFKFPIGQKGDPGPAYLPRIILLGLALLCIFQVFIYLKNPSAEEIETTGIWMVVKNMILAILYFGFVPYLGYFSSTFIYLIITMRILKIKNWFLISAVSFLFTMGTYIIFYYLLSVFLPTGIIDNLII